MDTDITLDHIKQVLDIFQITSYEAGNCEETVENTITRKCEELYKLDYNVVELENLNGTLSTRYPSRMFIPEYEKNHNHNFLNNYDNGGGAGCSSGIGPPSPNMMASQFPLLNNSQKLTTQQQQQQQYQQQTQQNVIYEDLCDITKLREKITMAKYARCRQRFIVPVIMFRGKYICRSATISVFPETYGQKCCDYVIDCLNGSSSSTTKPQQSEQQQPPAQQSEQQPPPPQQSEQQPPPQQSEQQQLPPQQETDKDDDDANNDDEDSDGDDNEEEFMEDENDDQSYESIMSSTEPSPFTYEEVIKSDIELLNSLNVTTIIDLMMEYRKIKFFLPVSSSEKALNHYENFNLLSLPYPGCEFFKKFRDNNYMAKNLLFNWRQKFINAKLTIPKNSIINDMPDINWTEYKNWDLVLITQNYVKAILKYMQDENNGLLIHCISGWDRTPLFVSLIRLSLWADGLIHQSLSPIQITYLTLAYDWYLFGHQLPDRITRGEDILFFTFYFLKHLTDDEFAVENRKRTKTISSSSSSGGQLVFKHDYFDDDSKDDSIMEEPFCDPDSNDSFVNLEIANANENTPTNITKNRSPNSKRNKTSPISVPGVPGSSRQRNDSSSSNNSFSWQFINDAGSIDSVRSHNLMRYVLNDQQPPSGSAAAAKPIISIRKQRLNTVRSIFVQSYGRHVGLRFQEGSSLNITNILEQISDQLF